MGDPHELALVVRLDDQSVGDLTVMKTANRAPRPPLRAHPAGNVGEHICMPVLPEAVRDDPALIADAVGNGRIDRDDDALERRRTLDPVVLDHRPGPQRAINLIQDLGLELLAGHPAVSLDQVLERRRVEVRGVVERVRPLDPRRRRVEP